MFGDSVTNHLPKKRRKSQKKIKHKRIMMRPPKVPPTMLLLFSLLLCSLLCRAAEENTSEDESTKECAKQCNDDEVPWFKSGKKGARKFEANGCGAGGIRLAVSKSMERCCIFHDACYGICGVTRDYCDKEFDRCLNKQCEKASKKGDQSCSSMAQIMSGAVTMLGCQPFMETQEMMCECRAEEEGSMRDRVKEYMTEVYQEMGEEDYPDHDKLDQLIDKFDYSDSPQNLISHMIRKYRTYMVDFQEPKKGKGKPKQVRLEL